MLFSNADYQRIYENLFPRIRAALGAVTAKAASGGGSSTISKTIMAAAGLSLLGDPEATTDEVMLIPGPSGPIGPKGDAILPLFSEPDQPEDPLIIPGAKGDIGATGPAGGGILSDYSTLTKTSDQDVDNSTTLVDDTELQFSVTANRRYDVWLYLIFAHSSTSTIYKGAFHVSTGTMKGSFNALAGTACAASGAATTTALAMQTGASDINVIGGQLLHFAFTPTNNATLSYQFAQNSTSGGTSCRTCKGSMISWKDVT